MSFIFFYINAILMLINGCHGKTEDAEEKIVPLNEVSDSDVSEDSFVSLKLS